MIAGILNVVVAMALHVAGRRRRARARAAHLDRMLGTVRAVLEPMKPEQDGE